MEYKEKEAKHLRNISMFTIEIESLKKAKLEGQKNL